MNKEELKIQLLQIARVGLTAAVLFLVMFAGVILAKQFMPDMNGYLLSAIGVGSAIATYFAFGKIIERMGIAKLGGTNEATNAWIAQSGVSINSVHFGNMMPGLKLIEKNATTAKWHTPEGDIVILRLFPEATTNEVPLTDMQAVRAQYKEMAAKEGGALVDINLESYSGVPCLEMISKTKMKPTGMAYAASASLLLKDFCFNIGYHSPERGMTGLRDSLVSAKMMSENPLVPLPEFQAMWFEETTNPDAAQRNRSDDEIYDAEFPDHPLSKCRKFLRDLRTQIVMEPEVRNAEPFKI